MICNKGKLGIRVETGNEQDIGNNMGFEQRHQKHEFQTGSQKKPHWFQA